MHVFADPTDVDTVWVADYSLWKSIDGGKTFVEVATPHGDNHDLWIDPSNSRRMIEGNDGGACVTLNGGADVVDASTTSRPRSSTTCARTTSSRTGSTARSRTTGRSACRASPTAGAITATDWVQPGGGESGYIAVKPGDPAIVVGGSVGSGPGMGRLIHYDHRTGQERIISVWPEAYGMGTPPAEHRYRFQWTFPVFYSRWDPRELWIAGNRVFRSVDEGQSWEVVSPDLTRNDPAKLGPSGGPITRDNTGAEVYCTIFALVESPHERDVLWAGTDDGLVHLSRDRGRTWQPVTPPDLPRVGAGERARAVPARRGDVLRRGDALQARRHAPLSLQDERLRPHVDAHHGEPAGRRDHARRARGPEPARPALLRHRDRRVGLARRRRRMAAAPRESAGGADPRSHRQGHRPGRGHARAVVLDPRRPLAAPPDGRRHRRPPTRTSSRRARRCGGARTAATA